MAGKHSDHNFHYFLGKNEKNEKFLELPDLARNLTRKTFERHMSMGGERRVKRAQTRERGPPSVLVVLFFESVIGSSYCNFY